MCTQKQISDEKEAVELAATHYKKLTDNLSKLERGSSLGPAQVVQNVIAYFLGFG